MCIPIFKVSELIEATRGSLVSGRWDAEISGVSIDSRTIKKGNLFIAIKGDRFDGHDFIARAIRKGAKAIVAKKIFKADKSVPVILVKDTIKALGDIAHFHRKKYSIPVIGITGSNGKTTAKDMSCFLLEAEFCVLKNLGTQNNQIGLPLTLLKLNENHDIVILEMGTSQFGEIKRLSQIAEANIGVLLNIGPSHLEFFGNLKGVFQEKLELIKNLASPNMGILNNDDRFLNRTLKEAKDKFLISFGVKNKCDFRAENLYMKEGHSAFRLNKYNFILNTPGLINVYNALASIVIARIFGLGYPTIISRLKKFNFPEGRLNVKKINNKTFIDDTYNSNPVSLHAAIDVLKNIKTKARKIVVLGDMLELGPSGRKFHVQVGKQISKICDIIITAGTLSKAIALTAKKEGFKSGSIFICGSSKEAKGTLFNIVKPSADDIILVKGSRLMKMEEILR